MISKKIVLLSLISLFLVACGGTMSQQTTADLEYDSQTAYPVVANVPTEESVSAPAYPTPDLSSPVDDGEYYGAEEAESMAGPAPVMQAAEPAPMSVGVEHSRRDIRRSKRAARRERRARESVAEATKLAAPMAPSQPSISPSSPPPPPPVPSGSGVVAVDTSTATSGPVVVTNGQPVQVALPAPPPPPAPTYEPVQVIPRLTAASVGDVDRRGNYLSYLTRHPYEQSQIGLDMSRRVRFRVLDGQNRPLHDARITLHTGAGAVQGRTHADGYWDFFPGVSAPQAQGPARVTIQWNNQQAQTTVTVPAAGDARDVVIQLPQAVAVAPSTLDLAFAIDVTGSMGDELRYVTEEVMGIVARVRRSANQVNVRVAATFYRDRGDVHPVQQLPFSTDVRNFMLQMRQITAGGGGDYPEDMNAGLSAAINSLNWSTGPAVRVLVVIADAPPQQYPDAQYTYVHTMRDAASRGIRILPVAASGSDRVVEYLFRAMGAFTSTPYVYLTDDSGIGGRHMEADTDRISVEMFNDLLVRLLVSDLQGQGMHEPSHAPQGQNVLVGVSVQ